VFDAEVLAKPCGCGKRITFHSILFPHSNAGLGKQKEENCTLIGENDTVISIFNTVMKCSRISFEIHNLISSFAGISYPTRNKLQKLYSKSLLVAVMF